MKKLFFILLIILLFIFCFPNIGFSYKIDKYRTKYDILFKKYTIIYFGKSMDYRYFKAQCFVESAFNENAKSPVGALSLMQIMPATWRDINSKNKHFGSVFDARWNIAGGIYYDKYLYDLLNAYEEFSRINMMFASYNGGLGNVKRAIKICKSDYNNKNFSCEDWESVVYYAHKVKQWKCDESLNYVVRINKLMKD